MEECLGNQKGGIIWHEAFFEEGWNLVGMAEDEDGDAYDIVLSADKTEYRYTNI